MLTSYQILISYETELSSRLHESLPSDISFEFLHSEEARFLIKFSKRFDFFNIEFLVTGSEARVFCNFEVSKVDESIRNRVLSMLSYGLCKFSSMEGSLYEFTLWKGKKDFTILPSIDKLVVEHDLRLELSGRPCQIHTADLALIEIIKIQSAFIEWFKKDVIEDVSVEMQYEEEGASYELVISRYERSKINRKICIDFHGTACKICSINMEGIYGDIAEGFIHVHHIEKLATSGIKVIDPIKDLIPVCPNCHGIIHRTETPALPDEIRNLIKKQKGECL